ncbi:hypothetical protein HanIR_Chr15g0740251 [Helianthus annuus]|nr:hypothetical protein HanIR_Chr15g0740251 [Helianthus annuus]
MPLVSSSNLGRFHEVKIVTPTTPSFLPCFSVHLFHKHFHLHLHICLRQDLHLHPNYVVLVFWTQLLSRCRCKSVASVQHSLVVIELVGSCIQTGRIQFALPWKIRTDWMQPLLDLVVVKIFVVEN